MASVWWKGLAAALVVSTASPAWAAEPAADLEGQRNALGLAQQGVELFGADKFEEAFERFRAAEAQFHAAPFVLYMARCQRKLGRLLEARAVYEKLANEPAGPEASGTTQRAARDAKEELTALDRAIPTLQIALAGDYAAPSQVRLDGAPLTREQIATPLALNPGAHEVEAFADGHPPLKKTVTLVEGARETLLLSSMPTEAMAPMAPPLDAPEPSWPGPSYVPAASAFGVGLVGLGVSAVTGVMALSKMNEVRSKCFEGVCPEASRGDADTASTLATISTATGIVGGVGLVVGATLLTLRSDESKSDAQSAAWGARIGLGSVEVKGWF